MDKMAKTYIRAICVFGRMGCISDKYEDTEAREYPLSDFDVTRSYEGISAFLEKNARKIEGDRIKVLPYLEEGIISGPNVLGTYAINNCIVANTFVSGNGFNFRGVYHTLISLGLSKEEIAKNFEILKNESGWKVRGYWEENPKFKKDIVVPEVKAIESLTKLISLE
jgi:hypothetical protein